MSLDALHPTFVGRLERFLADPEIAGRFSVGSTVRTYEQQKRLYNGWLRRLTGFNLAANPDRIIGRTPDGWMAKGSWHMIQADGWGYAVDLRKPRLMRANVARDIVDRVTRRYGLRRTVPTEWWHIQGFTTNGWFDDPSAPPPPIVYANGADDMVIMIDVEGNHAGEVWIVGGAEPVDITNSSARETHIEQFRAAGRTMLLSYAGDIVRASYPDHFE